MDYGEGPAANEPEVVIFGPGYGEAIAVHLGDHKWMLIDSCQNPETKKTASLEYLDAIGAGAADVVAIVASHWHDDHVRGISQICARFPNADLFISGIFSDVEASTFLAAFSGAKTNKLSRGTQELYDSVNGATADVVPTFHRTGIADFVRADQVAVKVFALSPTTAGQAKALEHFASYIPREDDEGEGAGDGGDAAELQKTPINYAPELKPNSESVVIHVSLGDEAILLGSDLEHHGATGWKGIVDSVWGATRPPASIYKVAHHGSVTGEFAGIWTTLVRPEPICVLTPFVWGKSKLPTEVDRQRIRGKSGRAYISSGASRRAWFDRETENNLESICDWLTPVNNGFGAVRLRLKNGAWGQALFGDAIDL